MPSRRPPRRRRRPRRPANGCRRAGGAGVIGRGGGPMHVDLAPMQPQWTKICGPDPNQGNKQTCLTSRDFSQGQQPTMSIAVFATDGVEKHTARFLLPNGMLIKPGFHVVFDKSEPIEGHFVVCFPAYCFGDIEFGAPTLALMKKTQVMSVVMRNQGNVEVTLSAPLKDFGAAFDGPSIDPKVLQQQQEELQKQLEKQAQDQRARWRSRASKACTPALRRRSPHDARRQIGRAAFRPRKRKRRASRRAVFFFGLRPARRAAPVQITSETAPGCPRASASRRECRRAFADRVRQGSSSSCRWPTPWAASGT